MRAIPSPYRNDRAQPMNRDRLEKGREIATRTHSWMEAHESDFWLMLGYVKHVRGGRVRDRVAAFCVDHGIEIDDGEGHTFNNTFWAGISRYMVLHDPGLRDNPIRFRESAVDCFGLWPVSYLPGLGGDET